MCVAKPLCPHGGGSGEATAPPQRSSFNDSYTQRKTVPEETAKSRGETTTEEAKAVSVCLSTDFHVAIPLVCRRFSLVFNFPFLRRSFNTSSLSSPLLSSRLLIRQSRISSTLSCPISAEHRETPRKKKLLILFTCLYKGARAASLSLSLFGSPFKEILEVEKGL